MLRECPYTADRRDVLENTSPEAREIPRGNLKGRIQCQEDLLWGGGHYWPLLFQNIGSSVDSPFQVSSVKVFCLLAQYSRQKLFNVN